MTDRDLQIAEALTDTTWRDWERRPIAGDASSRRYFRLRHGDRSVILMDAPPAVCRDTPRFVAIAEHLSNAGLNAPRILYHNTHLGVLVLTDLGPDHVAAHLQQTRADEGMIYHAAADLLDAVSAVPALPDLPRLFLEKP